VIGKQDKVYNMVLFNFKVKNLVKKLILKWMVYSLMIEELKLISHNLLLNLYPKIKMLTICNIKVEKENKKLDKLLEMEKLVNNIMEIKNMI
jgi:hypothetical protein